MQNKNPKDILIYGDSLVYGKLPKFPIRYERPKNFIGVLENELGGDYRIIDEGLRARTLSGENGLYENRNGLSQFGPILGSHLPLDLVCIFLGINDCNKKDTKNKEEIYSALIEYKKEITTWCKNLAIDTVPKIMIISPPIIRSDQTAMDEGMTNVFEKEAEEKSRSLKDVYKSFCENEDCIFFNADEYCKTVDGEGIHLDEENNILLGKAIAEKIKIII